MTQRDVEECLEKHPQKWFTSLELAKRFKINKNSISANLRKLFRSGSVERRIIYPESRCNKGMYYLYRIKKQGGK